MKLYDINGNLKIEDKNCKTIKELCEKYKNNLEKASLRKMDLVGINFEKANLWGASFKESNLFEVNFKEAKLYGTNFRGADLKKADFRKTELIHVDFWGANLQETNLQETKFIGVDFRRVNLYKTKLKYFIVNGSKHNLFSVRNQIQIACEIHDFDYWLENYKKIGIKHDYTDFEIIEYKKYIDTCIGLLN